MQRFKAALTTGRQDPSNPEDLRRDDKGEYVLFKDVELVLKANVLMARTINKLRHLSCNNPAMEDFENQLEDLMKGKVEG